MRRLDVRLDGKEELATMNVMEICMGSIVQRSVVLVLTLNNVTTLMGLVRIDVTGDSMDLVVLKNVQTDRMDTTVSRTVALIAKCLECVTGKQDIATVKWGGNQIHVTLSVTTRRSDRIVPKSADIACIMNSANMLTAIVRTGVISDFLEPTVRRDVPGVGTVITVTRHVSIHVS